MVFDNELASQNDSEQDPAEIGRSLLREGRVDEGIAQLRASAKRRPELLGDIAWALHLRGRCSEALDALKTYIRHFPEDPAAWTLMARLSRERCDRANAVFYADKAVALDPDTPAHWFDLGEVFLYANDFKRAEKAFRRCLALDPSRRMARVQLHHALRYRRLARTRFSPINILKRIVPASFFNLALFETLIESETGVTAGDERWKKSLHLPARAGGSSNEQDGGRKIPCDEHIDAVFPNWFESLDLKDPVRKVLALERGGANPATFLAERNLDAVSIRHGPANEPEDVRGEIVTFDADMHFIPQVGGAFDLVVADRTIHRSRAVMFDLWEWKRLLREGGYLIVTAHLAVDRPHPEAADRELPSPDHEIPSPHYAFGTPGQVTSLTYWQMRWLFRNAGLVLVAETLVNPATGELTGTEHADGRRSHALFRPWDAFFLLQKPGRSTPASPLEAPRFPMSPGG